MTWKAADVLLVTFLFLLAGLFEIGGGWLVWQAVRKGKPWWWAALGCVVLVVYGFLPTLQPIDDFGRLYAVYGGVFIALSFLWGWGVDKMDVDKGICSPVHYRKQIISSISYCTVDISCGVDVLLNNLL